MESINHWFELFNVSGELLSVNPSVANWIGGLFSLNERAVYIGDWEHGFFSMTAVGATNVGSIKVYDDPVSFWFKWDIASIRLIAYILHFQTLQTNVRSVQKNSYEDLVFDNPIKLKKGDCFGEFNLGSTIVLIFEAPHDFRFSLGQCRRVKVGRGLACDVQKQVHVGAKGSWVMLFVFLTCDLMCHSQRVYSTIICALPFILH